QVMDDQTKRKLRTRRTFSGQIRKQAVDEFRSGKYSVKELAGLYHCSKQTIYRWIHQYSPADQPKIRSEEHTSELQSRFDIVCRPPRYPHIPYTTLFRPQVMDDQTKRKLRTRRTFSGQIRKQAVDEFRSGKYSVKELAGLYHCSKQTIYRWIHQYSPADQPKI